MPVKQPDFETSMAELETIVRRMEQGEQPLEQALEDFERGMVLAEQCRKSLESAQQRVDKLVKKHGGYALQALEDAEEGDAEEYDG
ncbi:MAG: exodeoxyribonuclease VII small subunit [Gammaproteobacteria bacterium]